MVSPEGEPAPSRGGAYTYRGPVRLEYRPVDDDDPDPGEIVWSWVAYEDDATVGKDRPVAVIGRAEDRRLACLMLSSRNHDGDDSWLPIGSGPWDGRGRPSWVRVDRILAVDSRAVRREGAAVPRSTYEAIVAHVAGTSVRPAPRGGIARRALDRVRGWVGRR